MNDEFFFPLLTYHIPVSSISTWCFYFVLFAGSDISNQNTHPPIRSSVQVIKTLSFQTRNSRTQRIHISCFLSLVLTLFLSLALFMSCMTKDWGQKWSRAQGIFFIFALRKQLDFVLISYYHLLSIIWEKMPSYKDLKDFTTGLEVKLANMNNLSWVITHLSESFITHI